MAKKGVIISANIPNIGQAWGGVNNEATTINVLGTDVPPGKPWALDFASVEEWIKKEFKGRCGSACFSPSPNQSNHYELWGFATPADQATYMAEYNALSPGEDLSQDIENLRLFVTELPIAATDTDTYTVTLATGRTGSTLANPIVVQRGGKFEVPIRVTALHYPPQGEPNQLAPEYAPTIIVERSIGGSSWDVVGSVPVTEVSGLGDDTFPMTIDVGSMIDTGSDTPVQIRFQIPSFVYQNSAGDLVTMTSNRVTLYLRTVTLGISMPSSEWAVAHKPIGTGNTIGVAFALTGGVPKTLHVKFSKADMAFGNGDYSRTIENVTATGTYEYSITDDAGTLGVTTSGVHILEAWLTYGSDDDMIETDHIIHQILVMQNDQDGSVGPRVLIQDMATSVDNFVQSVLCHYWVWNPVLRDGIYINDTTTLVGVRFIAADSANLEESHTEYVTVPVSVTPGTDCTLLATMEVESQIAADAYSAQLHALTMDGTPMLTPSMMFSIDNTSGFQPTAGSNFHLNPKSRNNSEAQPQTIVNARTGAVVTSSWENFKMDNSDGYTTDSNGEKVLLVPAGRLLSIGYNPLRYMHDAPSAAKGLTMCYDIKVNNVTNEDDAVVRLCQFLGSDANGEHYLGLRLRPMVGTMGSVSDNMESTTDFRWAEDRREHITVTITPAVRPNVDNDARYREGIDDDASQGKNVNGTINLVRVYINGVIVREMEYNPSRINAGTGKGVEFFTGDDTANPGIIIGQEGTDGRNSGADVLVYGIRVWERGLTPAEVLQTYVSSLPGSEEKRRIKAQNDILRDDNSGRISLPKACASGKNCMIWHGVEPMISDDSKKGWLEIRRYDYDGNYLPQYSGSFCKATKKLKGKGQGTTAMTYFYWNIQWKYGDIGYDDDDRMDPGQCIVLTPSQISDIIHLGTPKLRSTLSEDDQDIFSLCDESYTHVCPVYGGNLGKDEPVGTGTKNYPCTVDGSGNVATILMPDGWVNGNGDLVSESNPLGGKYCGPCWQAGPGLPYGSKHVLKINYASSMQSHLIGINWLYNTLHTAYVGANSLQRDTPSACVAKQVVPVLFFTAGVNDTSADVTDGTANFRGLGGYGPGKMDKPAWGYNKKASKITDSTSAHYRPNGHDYFAMFEGAVNNTLIGDMLAPFDDTDHLDAGGNIIQRAKVKYWLHDPVVSGAKDPESFYYRVTSDNVDSQTGQRADLWQKCIGFDGGKTGRSAEDGLLFNSNSCDSPDDAPSAQITGILRNAFNYVYLHNPNIRYFNGTTDELAAAAMTDSQRKRKYITRDSFLLKRWDFCEHQWLNAGLWNEETHAYDPINIFEAIGSPANIQNDRQAVVDAYIAQIVAEARPSNNEETNGIGQYFKAKSLRFHYAFENHFIAGTDNCSKNTYYVIDPVTHLIEMHQDDVDTTLATDNFGFQTKPYYVDRMNPWDDKDTQCAEDFSCYDGMFNGLFDLTEAMWAANGTIANTLNSILNMMQNLTGGIGSAESDAMGGVWKALNRYLFDIQRYFPQSTYNETARIRYEFPAMLGFVGRNGEAPCLQQSMGDQLEAEIQFMRRRLVYMASYAGFGDFAPTEGGNPGTTGLSDASARLAVNSTMLPNGAAPDQVFVLTPHQYLFPVFSHGQTSAPTRVRCAPGVAWTHTTDFAMDNNPTVLHGLNYYRSVGNLGDKTINAGSFNIEGTRLTEFIAEPTMYYPASGAGITRAAYLALSNEQKASYAPAFQKGSNLQVTTATRLHKLSLNGCTTTGSSPEVPFDLSRLTLAEEIDLTNTAMQVVNVPQTSMLTTLRLPATLTALSLTAQPSLVTLTIGSGYTALKSVEITGCPQLSAAMRLIVSTMAGYGTQMTKLVLKHIAWTGSIGAVPLAQLRWMLNATELYLEGHADNTGYDFSVSGEPSYDDVCAMIQHLGNFRSASNPIYIGIADSNIGQTSGNLSIGGMKYINVNQLTVDADSSRWWERTDEHPRNGLWAEVANGNNVAAVQKGDGSWVPDVRWDFVTELDGNVVDNVMAPNYASFPVNVNIGGTGYCVGNAPRMQVLGTAENIKLVVRMRMTLANGTELSRTMNVGMWWRIPQVGDFAWSDGTFSDENDASKTLAGLVIMREWLDEDGNVLKNATAEDAKKWRLWVMAAANATVPAVTVDEGFGTAGGITTPPWGLYPDNAANSANGYSSAWDSANQRMSDGLIEAIRVAVAQWSNDTKHTTYNIDSAYKTGSSSYPGGDPFNTPLRDLGGSITMSPSNYQSNDDTPACNGTNMGAGDGSGYAAQSNAFQIDFDTFAENDILLSYANTILSAVQTYIRNTIGGEYSTVSLDVPTTPGELASLLQKLYTILGSQAKARQIAFPAFRACAVWSPADINPRAMVDEQYARGKWMLPSSGLLARIYNFLGNSRATYNSNAAAVNKNITLPYSGRESAMPLFSIAIQKGRSVDVSYGSNHWSSTEYNRANARSINFSNGNASTASKCYTNVVARAVAAFTFVP